jgi:serine/threonine protein kinase/GNAT superfamily N-acetyltransferase
VIAQPVDEEDDDNEPEEDVEPIKVDMDNVLIKLLTNRDVPDVSRMFARLFRDDPRFMFVMGDKSKEKREQILRKMYYPSFVRHFVNTKHGAWGAFFNGKLIGVALVNPPDVSTKIPSGEFLKLIMRSGANFPLLKRFGTLAMWLKQEYGDRLESEESHWDLIYVGVDRAYQGQGIGRRLMHQVLKKGDLNNTPVSSYTFNEKYLPFLRKFGFIPIADQYMPDEKTRFWIQFRKPPSEVEEDNNSANSFGTTSTSSRPKASFDDQELASMAKYIIKPKDLIRDRKIGEGAYGVVYRGTWRNVTVAIKEVKVADKTEVANFQREALRMQSLVPHPNVVQFTGVCLEPFTIVTKFYPNGGLDGFLYNEPRQDLDDELRLKFITGCAYGINHLHQEGIVHRDLAARNVLLADDMTPIITDFGMAREGFVIDDNDPDAERKNVVRENQTKSTVGPIKWMAPEQLETLSYSTRSDVWAYGVIVYEILTRELPWKNELPTRVCALVMAGETLRLPESVPRHLRDLVMSCWKYKAHDRPTMAQVVDAVHTFHLPAGQRKSVAQLMEEDRQAETKQDQAMRRAALNLSREEFGGGGDTGDYGDVPGQFNKAFPGLLPPQQEEPTVESNYSGLPTLPVHGGAAAPVPADGGYSDIPIPTGKKKAEAAEPTTTEEFVDAGYGSIPETTGKLVKPKPMPVDSYAAVPGTTLPQIPQQ